MNTSHKVLCFAVVGLLIVILAVLGIETTLSGKKVSDIGASQIKKATKDKGNLLKSKYDGNEVFGLELVTLIQETIDNKETLSIVVRTKDASRTDYNYVFDATTNTISKTDATTTIETSVVGYTYINRNALFKCTVKTDKNDNVICLWFEQEK